MNLLEPKTDVALPKPCTACALLGLPVPALNFLCRGVGRVRVLYPVLSFRSDPDTYQIEHNLALVLSGEFPFT